MVDGRLATVQAPDSALRQTADGHSRHARILTIGEGTSEVQRLLIARGLGMLV